MAEQTSPSIITRINQMVWKKKMFWSRERVQVWFGSVSLFPFFLCVCVRCIAERLPSSTQTDSIAHWLSSVKVGRDERAALLSAKDSFLWTGTMNCLFNDWMSCKMYTRMKKGEKLFAVAYSKSKYMSHQNHCGHGRAKQSNKPVWSFNCPSAAPYIPDMGQTAFYNIINFKLQKLYCWK